jgi:hypothetical protein
MITLRTSGVLRVSLTEDTNSHVIQPAQWTDVERLLGLVMPPAARRGLATTRCESSCRAKCSATISPKQWNDLSAVMHGKLTAREKQQVAALRDGRVAIDVLMARMIEVDPSFLPTRSPAWPALVAIKAALDVAEA